MDEIWKDIDGYDGFYQSNYFDFISLDINQKSLNTFELLDLENVMSQKFDLEKLN